MYSKRLLRRAAARTRAGTSSAVSRREQTSAETTASLHIGVGVILKTRGAESRCSSRAFSGCNDEGGLAKYGREHGYKHFARHRPRGAVARRRRILLQTQGLVGRAVFALCAGVAPRLDPVIRMSQHRLSLLPFRGCRVVRHRVVEPPSRASVVGTRSFGNTRG